MADRTNRIGGRVLFITQIKYRVNPVHPVELFSPPAVGVLTNSSYLIRSFSCW
ncbi:MAG: hypothetical protein ISS16_08670 [Ignavibacteria bacterium]|nr:hypothetical protein [Ignavibacteria bacterium]